MKDENYFSGYTKIFFLPVLLLFSYACSVMFASGYLMCDEIIAFKANGICAYVFLCFENVSG